MNAGDRLDQLLSNHRQGSPPEGTRRVTVSDAVGWQLVAEAIHDSAKDIRAPDVTAIEIWIDDKRRGFCTLQDFDRLVVPLLDQDLTRSGQARNHIDTGLAGVIQIGKFTRSCKHRVPGGHQACRTVQWFARPPSPMPPCDNSRGWAAHTFEW